MKSRTTTGRTFALAVLLAIAAAAVLMVRRNPAPGSASSRIAGGADRAAEEGHANVPAENATAQILASPAPPRSALEGQPALNPPRPGDLSSDERSPLADGLGAPKTRPEDEPRIVLNIFNAYRRALGAYPAGANNRQFVNALLGANAQNLPFIPMDHPRLNARGELVDAWGTPFFFHENSRESLEVRSAGPDRKMYTADDIVAGPPKISPVSLRQPPPASRAGTPGE